MDAGPSFLSLSFATVFLVFRILGYPFDEVAYRSSAPSALGVTQRIIGVAYVILCIAMMTQIVPRLFEY